MGWRHVILRTVPGIALIAALAAPASAGDFLEWKRGDVTVKPAGYFQGDVRAFPGWDVDPDNPTLRSDHADVRRLRAGFEAKCKRVSGEFVVDLGDLANAAVSDDDPHPQFTMRSHVKNAYVQVELGKDHYVRAGHFKLPVTREFLTSAAKTDFVERSLLATGMAPGRDWGVMVGGQLGVAKGLHYMLGGFAGDGWSDNSRSDFTGAGRLLLEPRKNVEVAVSASLGKVNADAEDPVVTPHPHSLRGKSASGWSFFERVHVEGTRRRLGLSSTVGSEAWNSRDLKSRPH